LEFSKRSNLCKLNGSDLLWTPALHNAKTKALVKERQDEIDNEINELNEELNPESI
jgi:hypothetical protein